MNAYRDDPVLNLTASAIRLLRWLCLAFAGLVLLILALSAFAALVSAGEMLPSIDKTLDFFLILGVAGLYFLLLAKFFKMLRDIVLSTKTAQPLTAINARRLKSMGWLYLTILLANLLLVAGSPLFNGDPLFDGESAADLFEEGISTIGHMLIPATLFILARIFEQGAQMQEELEGTV